MQVPYNIQQTTTSTTSTVEEQHQDDIRLCTITRANATDPYGLELNYHKRDNYHSLKLTTRPDNVPSSKNLILLFRI